MGTLAARRTPLGVSREKEEKMMGGDEALLFPAAEIHCVARLCA